MTQPLPLALRLLRWATPVPADHRQLLPRFEQESRERLARLLWPTFIALLPFWAFFALTDWLLFPAQLGPLLLLRAGLMGTAAALAVALRRPGVERRVYWLVSVSIALSTGLIVAMAAAIGQPAGLYVMSLFGTMGLLALVPLPLALYVANVAAVAAIYALGMALAGWGDNFAAQQTLLGLLGGPWFFAAAHYYLERQRWEAFLTRARSDQLSRQLQAELAMARTIQRRLLPPPSPGWPSPDLACWSEPAREVGGDFYAYINLGGRVGVAVGDVSGKGMPAALLMSTCLASLQAAVGGASSPAALLGQLDTALAASTRATRQNCALCCVELDGRRLRVANAGGVAPLLRRADGSVCWVEAGGLPLGTGLSAALGYRDVSAELAAGDLLVLVSDGVVEAMNEADELFGFERLERALAAIDAPSAFAAVAELREAVAAFVGIAESHDDMTVVALRVPG